MRKKLATLLAILGVVGFGFTLQSCEDSDRRRTEDRIERGVERAGDKIEDAGDEVEDKLD